MSSSLHGSKEKKDEEKEDKKEERVTKRETKIECSRFQTKAYV
jgi:hypothetical protein